MDLELTTLHVNDVSGVAAVTIDHAPVRSRWNTTMTDPALDARFDSALAVGAQTRAGELDLDATLRTALPADGA